MTISTWFKASSFSPARWRTPLHRNDGTSIGSSVFFIGLESGTSQIVSTIGCSGGAAYMAGATGVIAQTDNGYHVVNSWDGTTARIYINGVQKGSYSFSAASYNNKASNTKIGSSGFGDGYLFNGDIDEVAIWNRTLSVNEIKDIYQRGAAKLNLSVKSCDDSLCDGESWINLGNNLTSPQNLSISNNSYFQYKFDFSTDNSSYTPKLYNISIDYNLLDTILPQLTLNKPENNKNISSQNIKFNFTAIEDYPQRNGVENGFGCVKKKYGGSVSGKKWKSVRTEIFCKAILHNINLTLT